MSEDRLEEIKYRGNQAIYGDPGMLADLNWLISEVERLREKLDKRIPHDNIGGVLEENPWIEIGMGVYECPCAAHQSLTMFRQQYAGIERQLKDAYKLYEVKSGEIIKRREQTATIATLKGKLEKCKCQETQ